MYYKIFGSFKYLGGQNTGNSYILDLSHLFFLSVSNIIVSLVNYFPSVSWRCVSFWSLPFDMVMLCLSHCMGRKRTICIGENKDAN